MLCICPHFQMLFGLASFDQLGLHGLSQTVYKGAVSSKKCLERSESQLASVRSHCSFVSIASITFCALGDGTFTNFMRFL